MSQSQEEHEECFIPSHWEDNTPESAKDFDLSYLNINKLLQQAKQLHNRTKPQSLTARTCFLQLPILKLPLALQQQCDQEQQLCSENRPCITVTNDSSLSFSQYFKDYEQIYNKIRMYNQPGFQLSQLTCRFKPISHLADFHEKQFKELQSFEQIDKKNSPFHLGIYDSFDSNFQSGNLGLVYKNPDAIRREYFLLLQNDINTHGYASWFFFKVMSCGKGKASFHILNLSKSPYLYKIGWKISIFSTQKYRLGNKKWFKGGSNIQTYSTSFEKRSKQGGTYSCLYFQYDFQQWQTEVYFAMNKPYTYTKMCSTIERMQTNLQKTNTKLNIIKSVYSVSCNIVPILVLQNESEAKESIQIEGVKIDKNKKILLFMARQHPGQLIGSFLMDQLINMVEKQVTEIKSLMKLYTIVLIPMANPDGVVHGNSRCNLAGLDLNRQWMKQSMKEVTPETYYLRKIIWQLQDKVGFQYIIDLHGHSKKMNSFFFCNKYGDKLPSQYLPYISSKLDKKFDLGSCTFNTTPDKKNTLRNQLYEYGMKNCVTVQNSYFGYWEDKCAKLYKQNDFKELSMTIVKALYFMLVEETQISHFSMLFTFSRQQIANQIKNNKELIAKKLNKNCMNDDMQSESDPEGDIMKPQQMVKIYQYKDVLNRKSSTLQSKRKLKTKNTKSIKQKRTKASSQMKNQQDDQIRKSQPGKFISSQRKFSERNHKSQKKLQTVVQTKKSLASKQTIRETSTKPVAMFARKNSDKKQSAIRTTYLNINKNNQKNTITNQTCEDRPPKNSLSGNTFYRNMNYEACLNKSNKRRIQNRIRTEGQQKVGIKKNVTLTGNYGQLRDERLRTFLNQTLSIIKVNNHEMMITSNQEFTESQNIYKKDSIRRKISSKGIHPGRIKTQGSLKQELPIFSQTSTGLESDIQKQQRRKIFSNNYRKQLLKRKKILSIQDQVKNYRRFQNFIENEDKTIQKGKVEVQSNSVFYYFPVL